MSRIFAGTQFDHPQRCEKCGKPEADCRCLNLPPKKKSAGVTLSTGLTLTPKNSSPPPDQVAKIRTEKRKGNRHVTIISGMDHPANDLPKLCTDLKQALSVGGSVQGRTIELQGDHAEKILTLLTAAHLKARIV